MESIKEAFSKVKQDINLLFSELSLIREELKQTRDLMIELGEIVKQQQDSIFHSVKNLSPTDRQTNQQTDKQLSNNPGNFPTQNFYNPTNQHIIPTHPAHFTPLNTQNQVVSIGNEGVPTDRQTNQQTNQQTHESSHNPINNSNGPFNNAIEALDSLDSVKKEIRLKFKRLTDQEMSVFSLIYQISENGGFTDYRELSQKLNLTESSIRDYIGRLIKKGIPIEKKKINNKNIQLSISPNLKKVVSLQTLLQLREI